MPLNTEKVLTYFLNIITSLKHLKNFRLNLYYYLVVEFRKRSLVTFLARPMQDIAI